MPEQPGTLKARRWWTGLGWKLFAAFASVIAVGVATLWLTVGFAAPRFFDQQMAGMMPGGSGIGLTIAKALAEGMGGHIRAASPGAGQGSTFTFTLPVT